MINGELAIVDVVPYPPTGGIMAQVDWFGPNVGHHLALRLLYTRRVNRVNSRHDSK